MLETSTKFYVLEFGFWTVATFTFTVKRSNHAAHNCSAMDLPPEPSSVQKKIIIVNGTFK